MGSDLIEPRKLKGFRDFGPELQGHRLALQDKILQVARRSGFVPLATPAIEFATTLVGQGGGDTDKEVYRFTDHGDREVALRFDLTLPFARFVAEHQGRLDYPFKAIQIGSVWRGEKPQKGRYREFVQCDIDHVGFDSPAADCDVLITLATFWSEIRKLAGDVTISLGHRGILSALIRSCTAVETAHDEAQALIAIDKMAKIGQEGVAKLLSEKGLGSDDAGIERMLSALANPQAVREILGSAGQDLFVGYDQICATLRANSPEGVTFKPDLSIARGLGYYTGIVFETTLDELPSFGSVSSGGRYNHLVSRFTNRELPGVGGSVGIDRLLAALEEKGRLSPFAPPSVLVATAESNALSYAVGIAQELRRHGCRVVLGAQPKLKAQLKSADRDQLPWVIVVGETEQQQQTVNLRNMREGSEQTGIPRASLVGTDLLGVLRDGV